MAVVAIGIVTTIDLYEITDVQQAQLGRLGPLINGRFGTLQQILDTPPTANLDDYRRQRLFQQGVQSMSDVRQILSDMENEEQRHLGIRRFDLGLPRPIDNYQRNDDCRGDDHGCKRKISHFRVTETFDCSGFLI